MNQDNAIRLQVRMARAGIASRRKCEELIAEGRVTVNGKVVIVPGTKVGPEDDVRLDGRTVRDEKRKVYIALHKPAGFLCSDDDPDGRPLAKSLLEPVFKERIFHVGRLDYMTSGLIFFTNDGDFARALTHPSKKMEKEYEVTCKSPIPEELMDRFLQGLVVDGVRYKAKKAELIGSRVARIVLTEGKNRELRRVFLSVAASIKKVHRVRIGTVRLKGIESGRFRHLKEYEIKALMEGKGESTSFHRKKSPYERRKESREGNGAKERQNSGKKERPSSRTGGKDFRERSEHSSSRPSRRSHESRDGQRKTFERQPSNRRPQGEKRFSRDRDDSPRQERGAPSRKPSSPSPRGNRPYRDSRSESSRNESRERRGGRQANPSGRQSSNQRSNMKKGRKDHGRRH